MFDLIGFWGAVTLYILAILSPLVILSSQVAYHFVKQVTQSAELAKKAENFVWDNNDGWGNYSTIFTVKLHDVITVSTQVIGLVLYIPLLGEYLQNDLLPYETVAKISTAIAPYVGTVLVVAAIYVVSILLLRRGYGTYQKVDSALKKFNESSR